MGRINTFTWLTNPVCIGIVFGTKVTLAGCDKLIFVRAIWI